MSKFYGFTISDIKKMTLYQVQTYMLGLVGASTTEMEASGVKDIIYTVNQISAVEKGEL